MSALRRVRSPRASLKNTKSESLTPIVSASRLRRVQELMRENGSLPGIDSILCVLGIDSRHHDGSKNLANYLLFGFCDAWKSIMGRPLVDEDQFDDLVMVVKRHSVHVYCHSGLYPYLIDYISHWRNLRLHCLRDDCHFDEDTAEEFKMRSFVNMFHDCGSVGIPHSSADLAQSQPFDKMKIEKWPIVQAFALDEMGGGGFFTMKYQVEDVGVQVEQLYSMADPVTMETLISKNLPLFERQWSSLLTSLDIHILDGETGCLTEGTVGEPLLTYYKHGRVSETNNPQSQQLRCPFVLFGAHASRNNIEELHRGENSCLQNEKTSTIDGQLNLMVCQAVAPKSPLCCARTYCLGPLHVPFRGLDGMGDVGSKESQDTRHFQMLYSAVIEAVDKAMTVYTTTLSIKQTEKEALLTLKQKCSLIEDEILQQHLQKIGNVSLSIKAYDRKGNLKPMTEGVACPLVKTVTLTVYDVPSGDSPGKTLGSVLFAESFLDSTIKVSKPDGTEQLDAQFLVLTADIPRLVTWSADGCRRKEGSMGEDRWGKLLSPAEISQATARNAFSNIPVQGKTAIFERAIVFSHQQVGEICLTKEQVASLQLYDGDSPSKVAVLAVGYPPSVQMFIPASLRSPDNTLLVAFFPKSRAYKNLFSSVLPAWKDEGNWGLERLSVLPEKFSTIYDNLERIFLAESTASLKPMEKTAMLNKNFNKFMDHLSASSVGNVAIPERDLGAVLKQPVERVGQAENPEEILITIISGLPGSHKENLCQVLMNLAKEQNRWIIFKQPLDKASLFNPKALQQSLSSTLSVVRKKRLTSSTRQPSLLILTPGFTDVIEVVKAICSHPDPSVNEFYRIGAITCCIDPHTAFMEHRLTFPSLLNHCALGWVNNIVFTSSTSPQTPALMEIQDLIRSVNDDVAFILS
ncbi:dynein axonemal assembly factor 9-like isoform X2 [Liolophura sinensis]|uniref:dynein axonemal assembly factor 9-like isoform X2 n=1 Tax=Liolophura sinensis TaxID=3198878 RepID=UPI003158042B